jgi:hypothetical protein
MTFYLIGQITRDERTYQWRKDIISHFDYIRDVQKFRHNIKFLDPCGNNYARRILENTETVEDFRKFVKNTPTFSKLIPVRDGYYVHSSDAAICNMNSYTPEKPFIGTFFELAWYLWEPWKPVIGIYEGDYTQDLICMHPFVQRAVTTWVRDIGQACSVVEDMFMQGYNIDV